MRSSKVLLETIRLAVTPLIKGRLGIGVLKHSVRQRQRVSAVVAFGAGVAVGILIGDPSLVIEIVKDILVNIIA